MKLLNAEEKAWLNAYHKQVYTLISPGLNADERAWLKSETAPL
jgi:Xaa-Pro aminopeptidase